MIEYLKIGQITNAHGVKGEVKVYPLTDNQKRFSKLKAVFMMKNGTDSPPESVEITSVKYFKDFVILKLSGIDTMNDALKLKNEYLYIDREHAVKLPKDTYFISDLIGMEVTEQDGRALGKLTSVFPTGSNDVYEVKGTDGKTLLLPAIGEVILDVDVVNRKMLVHLLEGLL